MSNESLVIGVDGFLGGTFYDKLKNSGEPVIGTSLRVESKLAEDLGIIRHDLTNREETIKLICKNKPKIIADFAGIAAPSEVKKNPRLAWDLNVRGVMNVIYGVLAAREIDSNYNPVILIAGSVEEFGDGPLDSDGKPGIITEDSPYAPQNIYAEQKMSAEERAMRLCKKYNLNLYWIEQGNAIGSPDIANPENPIHLRHGQNTGFFITDVAKQIAALERSGNPQGKIVTGNTSHLRNFIPAESAAEAYLAIAKEKPTPGRYVIAGDNSISLEEIIKIFRSFSTIEIDHEIDEARGAKGKDRYISNKKLKKATGWTQTTTLEKALKLALEDQRRKVNQQS